MIYLTMFLFIKEGKEGVFHEFENLAIPILYDYNGNLIYRIRPDKESFITSKEEIPYEIHFISFNSEMDFENFKKDKRRLEFVHLKEESLKYSYIVQGQKL